MKKGKAITALTKAKQAEYARKTANEWYNLRPVLGCAN